MELKIRIKKEGKEFIARAEDYKVTAIGKTKEEAKANLKNNLIAYFEQFGT